MPNEPVGAIPPDKTLLAEVTAKEAPAVGTARASLIVLSGWEIGKQIPLNEFPCILGRSQTAHAQINVPSVSRQHAQIDKKTAGTEVQYWITDLGSSNGTHVNNTRVALEQLHNGDKIQLGEVILKFVLQDELDAHFHESVHRLIHYDQLTGLLTLDSFRARVQAILESSSPCDNHTLVMTDLDGLKRVNDTYGHSAGRIVIREMGQMLRDVLRPSDYGGLYGGDEAALFFSQMPIAEAQKVCESLRKRIEGHVFEFEGNRFRVTISQGLACYPRHGRTFEALVAVADRALYSAKAAGRNCVFVADDLR